MSGFMDIIKQNVSEPQIKVVAVIFTILSSIIVFMMIYNMMKIEAETSKSKMNRMRRVADINDMMGRAKFKWFNYKYLDEIIQSNGVKHMFKWMNPIIWMMLEVFAGLLVFITVAFSLGIVPAFPAGVIGFMAPLFIAQASNRSDNKEILDDLRDIYDIMRIQTRAGAYTSIILSDCYMSAKNSRLRSAFKQLISAVATQADMEAALDDFKSKFSNEYIDSLTIVIKQSLITGASSQMLDDIKVQIEGLERASIIAAKEKTEQRVIMAQLMLYAAIIAVSAFIAINAVTGSLNTI